MYQYYNNLMEAHLRRAGVVVRRRHTLEGALRQMAASRPALVVMLVGTSDPNGLDLLRKIKTNADFANVPTLGILEERHAHLASAAMAEGADKCVAVPFDPVKLADDIRNLVRQ